MIDIVIGGDICPIGRNLQYFMSGDAIRIFNDLLDDIRKADLSIINLECPLITKNDPIQK
jgi:poly-gamma-glutamate synthesis protein (capsule biosynthesis protein)